MEKIHFEKASLAYKDTVLKWLDEPHMKEFWDNSKEHAEDIVIFMQGRKEPTPYYDGIFTYWIGSIDSNPFSLIMTSEIIDEPKLKDSWRQNLSKTGKTYSLDFCIGNVQYFGKGLASETLKSFVNYFYHEMDNSADTFMIDPNENNPRARHVYEKAGFKEISTFQRRGETFHLMVKKMRG
jgi:RimJ/RimL family protein N-acetyltransferase